MPPYIPHTPADVEEMLQVLGIDSAEQLFTDIPSGLRLAGGLDLPRGCRRKRSGKN